jgi:hypothetical protein
MSCISFLRIFVNKSVLRKAKRFSSTRLEGNASFCTKKILCKFKSNLKLSLSEMTHTKYALGKIWKECVLSTKLICFGHCLSSSILRRIKKHVFGNIICFHLQAQWWETTSTWGPLFVTGPRVRCPSPRSRGWIQFPFPKFSALWSKGRWTRSKNPLMSSAIRHSRNSW